MTESNNKVGRTGRRSYAHVFYGLASIVCPYAALQLMAFYQRVQFTSFSPRYGPIDVMIEQVLTVGVGAVVGLALALFSLKVRRKIISFGSAGCLVNGIIIILVVLFFRGQF